MNDAERRQLVEDLLALTDVLRSAMQTAQGDTLRQLIQLANESEQALAELQQNRSDRGAEAVQQPSAMHA